MSKETIQTEKIKQAEERATYTPATDIRATPDGFVVVVDMPGVTDEGVDVNLEDNVLTVAGRTEAEATDGYEVLHQDFVAGDYERSFTLSAAIDRDSIEAQLKHGVLTLTLPKAKEDQPRQIKVQAVA